MNRQDYYDILRALDLLADFIESSSGELTIQDDRGVLENARSVLNGYVSCGGEV